MNIRSIIWLPEVIEKLEVKHAVAVEEVTQVFTPGPVYRRGARGKRRGENLYLAYGRTEAGRYLLIVFIFKINRRALILSAQDMSDEERRLYRRG